MTKEQALLVCPCSKLPGNHLDDPEQLFPFENKKRAEHQQACPLLALKTQHCKARLKELKQESARNPQRPEGGQTPAEAVQEQPGEKQKRASWFRKKEKLPTDSRTERDSPTVGGFAASLAAPATFIASLVTPAVQTSIESIIGIPYGNIHMSLMVGPLIIENGNPDFLQGTLCMVRERLRFMPIEVPGSSVNDCIGLDEQQTMYSPVGEHVIEPRRFRAKAFMKQVVGSPFWNVGETQDAEVDFVRAIAKASLSYGFARKKTPDWNQRKRKKTLKDLHEKLESIIKDRLKVYLRALVDKLYNPAIPLAFDILNNTCQKLCDNLIDRKIFSSFMVDARDCRERGRGPKEALYLLSFVSRPGSQDGSPRRVVPSSRSESTNGHTEEYLLRYRRFGHHNDTDIVDSLTEISFRGTAPRQEARMKAGRSKCGECKLLKHVWAFPFDSWSVAQLHLFRDRRFYSPGARSIAGHEPAQLNDVEWMQNRLRALDALQILGSVASAMHRSKLFRKNCHWDFEAKGILLPFANTKTNRASRKRQQLEIERKKHEMTLSERADDPAIHYDRIKLAGIYRAQPESHVFDHAKLHDCTLADWADLRHEDQVAAYKKLRDYRATHVDEIIESARRRSTRDERAAPPSLTAHGMPLSSQEEFEFDDLVSGDHNGSKTEVETTAGEKSGQCNCICDTHGDSAYTGGGSHGDGGLGDETCSQGGDHSSGGDHNSGGGYSSGGDW
ncbi:hypothetical protein OPT61_g7386 [Boeremia exigua]|uniref:Uncharacterized protein n=1 Tax=Boeremia exigua TaxID=749465 RepID=A0ACC2I2V8_9PLEO|nr:hypothetical protein OPT61_g7386 [Boeremia exigua]